MIISFNLDLKESTNGVSKHIYIILTGGVSSVYIFYYFEQKNLLSIINLTEKRNKWNNDKVKSSLVSMKTNKKSESIKSTIEF